MLNQGILLLIIRILLIKVYKRNTNNWSTHTQSPHFPQHPFFFFPPCASAASFLSSLNVFLIREGYTYTVRLMIGGSTYELSSIIPALDSNSVEERINAFVSFRTNFFANRDLVLPSEILAFLHVHGVRSWDVHFVSCSADDYFRRCILFELLYPDFSLLE